MHSSVSNQLTTNSGNSLSAVAVGAGKLLPVALAVALAVPTIVLVSLIPADRARVFLAMQLAVIGGIYIGFGIADGRLSAIAFEAVQAGTFIVIALCGVWYSWWFLVGGYFGHGLWDFAHHSHGVQTRVPGWYVPACVVYDWLVAAFLIVAFAV